MEQNLDDYSPASTIINFDHPIPLLRGPIPASPRDDPSSGPYVLGFKNPQSWASSYKICNSKINDQCQGGAQIGCAITASNKCKPPWWRNLARGGKFFAEELKEREQCEEREMQGCLAVAKEKCVGFANEKCFAPFREARISVREKEAIRKLLSSISLPERYCNNNHDKNKLMQLTWFDKCESGMTNCKASDLLGVDPRYGWFFKQK